MREIYAMYIRGPRLGWPASGYILASHSSGSQLAGGRKGSVPLHDEANSILFQEEMREPEL